MFLQIKKYFNKMKGFEKSPRPKKFSEILWSGLGAFLSMVAIFIFTNYLATDPMDNFFLIGSFGASAVLIYGAPQLDYSQPRNFIGGHIISTLVGVLIYKFLSFDLMILSALAVSLSIVAMHLTQTMHPPGGATALISIIGSSQIHDLGFYLIFSPILSGSCLMLCIALLINNLSNNPKRFYPKYWI
ncbi:Membrane protein, HPP family [hydrothermal vent metagenome]|uniref:Membrane protein, HPP family n=1 Tax=hydrothermal vent metagenome TaxID=652676 RepID=A0A1W1CE10_9ZZZZ